MGQLQVEISVHCTRWLHGRHVSSRRRFTWTRKRRRRVRGGQVFIAGGTARKKDTLQVLWSLLSDILGPQRSCCSDVDSNGDEGIDDQEIPSTIKISLIRKKWEMLVVLRCALCSSLLVCWSRSFSSIAFDGSECLFQWRSTTIGVMRRRGRGEEEKKKKNPPALRLLGPCGDTELRRWHRLRRSRKRCRRWRSQNFRSRCRSRRPSNWSFRSRSWSFSRRIFRSLNRSQHHQEIPKYFQFYHLILFIYSTYGYKKERKENISCISFS